MLSMGLTTLYDVKKKKMAWQKRQSKKRQGMAGLEGGKRLLSWLVWQSCWLAKSTG